MAETILIVEDNPETLELLRRIMERDGYKTILANDGEKGLSYTNRYMPDHTRSPHAETQRSSGV